MWHASVSPTRPGMPARVLVRLARKALRGVGDAALGEWVEHGRVAVHVRRRITVGGVEAGAVGPVRDLRNTNAGRARYAAVADQLPAAVHRLAAQELGDLP